MNCRACGKQIWDGPGFCRECREEGKSRIPPEPEAKREEKVGCSNCGSTEGPAYEYDYGVDREAGYHDCGVLCHECMYPGLAPIPEKAVAAQEIEEEKDDEPTDCPY